jgi:tetratricopeptide (TPR) repeat protein
MRAPSAFIWQLIQSLNRNERLYFKRNFIPATGAEDRLYIRLFDAIAAQKVYDEKALLEKFSPALNKKNIATQKNYLQKQVSDALVQYEVIRDPGKDVYTSIQLIRIYRKKGLYVEAFAIWKKAVELARTREAFAMLNLLKTEFEKMVIFSPSHSDQDELLDIFKQNVITYTEYAELITLRDIYTETLLLKKKTHFGQDSHLLETIQSLLERVNRTGTTHQGHSFWYRHYYLMSKATLLYLLNDIAGSLQLLKEHFSNWKKEEKFTTTHGEFYIELLYMINYAGILHGDFEYVTAVFNDPLNKKLTDPYHRAYFEVTRYLALNKIYNKTARYEEVKKLLEVMKANYTSWEPFLNEELNSTLSFSMGVGCFALEQYEDALFFTRRAITTFSEGSRDEHNAVGQLLLLLITFCLNNARLFDAQYRVTYQFFYKRKKQQAFETALKHCLQRCFYMTEQKKKIQEFKKALQLLEENRNNPIQQRAFAIFNFEGWLQSRVQRISYRQFVEKKVKAEMKEAV